MPCFLLLIVIVPLQLAALNDQKRRRPAVDIGLFDQHASQIKVNELDRDHEWVIDSLSDNEQDTILGKMDEFLALRMCNRHFHFSNGVLPAVSSVFTPIWQSGSSSSEDPTAIIVPIPYTVPYN